MPGVSRLGDKTSTGIPSTTASTNVFVNSIGVLRKTDYFGSPAVYVVAGIPNVFVNGLEVAVIGSLTNIPGVYVAEGSSDTFAGT